MYPLEALLVGFIVGVAVVSIVVLLSVELRYRTGRKPAQREYDPERVVLIGTQLPSRARQYALEHHIDFWRSIPEDTYLKGLNPRLRFVALSDCPIQVLEYARIMGFNGAR